MPFPAPGDPPDPGMEPRSSALAGGLLPSEPGDRPSGVQGLQCPLGGQDCHVIPSGGSLVSSQQVGLPPSPPPEASAAAQKPLTLARCCPRPCPHHRGPLTVVSRMTGRVRTWLIAIPRPTLVLRRRLTPESPLNGFSCPAPSVAAGGQAQVASGGRRTLSALFAK